MPSYTQLRLTLRYQLNAIRREELEREGCCHPERLATRFILENPRLWADLKETLARDQLELIIKRALEQHGRGRPVSRDQTSLFELPTRT